MKKHKIITLLIGLGVCLAMLGTSLFHVNQTAANLQYISTERGWPLTFYTPPYTQSPCPPPNFCPQSVYYEPDIHHSLHISLVPFLIDFTFFFLIFYLFIFVNTYIVRKNNKRIK